MIKRLRLKMVLINMTLISLLLCLLFGLIVQVTSHDLEKEARQISQFLAYERKRPDRFNITEHQIPLPYLVIDTGINGEIRASGFFDDTDLDIDIILVTILDSGKAEGAVADGSLWFCVAPTPYGTRCVLLDISSHRMILQNLRQRCALIGGVAFVLFLGLSFLLSRWSVRPVEQAWKQQQQFVGDASHELKTPLTVILTNAELLQTPEFTEDQRQQFSENILTMAQKMRGLVEDLLELARVDNGLARGSYADLDWSDLVSQAVLPFEPLYFEQSRLLESEIQPGLMLHGDERRLRQVVEILLDNALKYSAQDSTVLLKLTRQGRNRGLLSVSSAGTPLTSQERADIFKRFYRADKVRSLSGSYGLGLPIAHGIVSQHDGRIWAESTDSRNIFYVNLPLK